MKPLLVYSPDYDFSMFGIEKLHPFDGRKFSRAFARIRDQFGPDLERYVEAPASPATDDELANVHTRTYLDSLSASAVVARALETWPLRWIPNRLVDQGILRPMRLAVSGTILAMRRALDGDAIAMNLSGGYHHAFRDRGEGFCIYADVAVALAITRNMQLLAPEDRVVIIDLDAHRGNGVWDLCGADPMVHVLDVYNFQVYPGLFPGAVEDFPFQVPLKAHTADAAYLDTLRTELPRFLNSVSRPRLAIYNAGTDIVDGDPIGRLAVSPTGVNARDRMVLEALAERGLPTVIVTSGGYSSQSHQLIADLALRVMSLALGGESRPAATVE